MQIGVLAALLISALWIGLQIGWMHWRPAANRFRAMLTGFLLSLPWLALLLAQPLVRAWHADITPEPLGLMVFYALLTHLLIFFFYVECFYHIERAITFRMLIEIADHPEGVPMRSLQRRYRVEDMVATRMAVLLERGFVETRDGRWHLRPKGRLFAAGMDWTLRLYGVKSQRDRPA